jgi:hypothetical protein
LVVVSVLEAGSSDLRKASRSAFPGFLLRSSSPIVFAISGRPPSRRASAKKYATFALFGSF